MLVVDGCSRDKRFFYTEPVDKSHNFFLLVPFQERCRQAIKLPGFKQMRWEVVDVRGFYRAAVIPHFYWKNPAVISQQCSQALSDQELLEVNPPHIN